jgi:hypothetical protein
MRNIGFLLLVFSFAFVTAQDIESNWKSISSDPNYGGQRFLQLKLHTGSHLYTGQTFSDFLTAGYVATELRYGWQLRGDREWERAFNYPLVGIGIYNGNIGDPQYLGMPSGLYGFFHHPLFRRPRHHFDWELAIGLTYDLVQYNAETNPLNDAIGSSTTVYFNINLGGNYKLSEAYDLTYGLDLTHFSNGRTFSPNYGLNMAGLNVGLRYHYNPAGRFIRDLDPSFDVRLRPVFNNRPLRPKSDYKESSWLVYYGIGTVEHERKTIEGGMVRYMTWSLFTDYARRYSRMGSYTIGVDLFYDGSVRELYYEDPEVAEITDPVDMMSAGIHFGHALHIYKVNVETQFGFYFYEPSGYNGNFYMRIAGRYTWDNDLFLQIALKTKNGAAADWIEWGVGYTLWKNRKGINPAYFE